MSENQKRQRFGGIIYNGKRLKRGRDSHRREQTEIWKKLPEILWKIRKYFEKMGMRYGGGITDFFSYVRVYEKLRTSGGDILGTFIRGRSGKVETPKKIWNER